MCVCVCVCVHFFVCWMSLSLEKNTSTNIQKYFISLFAPVNWTLHISCENVFSI